MERKPEYSRLILLAILRRIPNNQQLILDTLELSAIKRAQRGVETIFDNLEQDMGTGISENGNIKDGVPDAEATGRFLQTLYFLDANTLQWLAEQTVKKE